MTDAVQPISDEQLPRLLAALAEAARADRRTADRFVAPRVGILEETAARRHQFVLGRRGVGKSTLLRKIESQEQPESNVVFVDIETLRSRPYPDVLIELLIELLTGLTERLKPDAWYRIDQRLACATARRKLKQLTTILRRLLAQPQVAQRTVRELQSKGTDASAGLFGGLRYRGQGAKGGFSGHRRKDSKETSVAARSKRRWTGCSAWRC